MAVFVDYEYIVAAQAVGQEYGSRLRERFHATYGPEEGDRMVDAMIGWMQSAIRSDDPSFPEQKRAS